MTLPVLAGIRPPSIGASANGQLALDILVNVRRHENYDVFLAPEMAVTYRRLAADCLAATGVALGISGGGAYRTIGQQITLFQQRYQFPPIAGRPTKTWQGKTYSLRVGANGKLLAVAAIPGTSNHGLGAAVDLAIIDPASGATTTPPFGSLAWIWVLDNAVAHGLSWELQSEPWHLRLIALPAPSQPPEEDEMAIVFNVASHPADLYMQAADGEVRHISGFEGAILEATSPGWAGRTITINVAADVDAWLRGL